MFAFEFFRNLFWEDLLLDYRPVFEQIILSSLDFQSEFVIYARSRLGPKLETAAYNL